MATRKRLSSPTLYTIAWVAALPIERAAATAFLEERHDEPDGFDQHANDANAYDWGEIGQHNIVIASLPAGVYGTTSAAITTAHLLSSLPHIRIGLLVGIGGGIPHPGRDIRLGDVVVSQPDGQNGGVIQYDLGKAKVNQTWEMKGSLNMPPPVLLHALGKLQAEHEIEEPRIVELLQGLIDKYPRMKKHYIHQGKENDPLFSSDYEHVGGSTCIACDSSQEVEKKPDRDTTDPEIHYGTVASGNTLVKDAAVRDIILQRVGEKCLCVEMEAAGLMNTFPCLVIRGICDYADSHKNDRWQRYAAATAAAFAVELLGCVRARQLEETPSARELMKSITTVDHKITNLKESIDSSHSKIVLDRLPIAIGAAHDAADSWLQLTCLKSTRVEVLREIYEWASDPSSPTLFWLNGMAGTGKSTISRTVAQHLAKAGTLGASFFFQKGETDRSNPSKLFTTLAAGLSRWQSAVSQLIKEAIDHNHQIFDEIPHQQFSKLILEPLSKATLRSEKPIVIVIDALDECQHHSITSIITDILPRARCLRRPRLKFFLTSRPELPIQAGFPNFGRRKTYQDMILQNVPRDVIQKDLETFLRRTIERIRIRYNNGSKRLPRSWPGKDAIQRLVNMATPLFIFASTVCRFVEDRRLGNPKQQMDKILAVNNRTHAPMLGQMYLAVLSQQFEDGLDSYTQQQKSQIVEEFRLIVGSIILLSTPLTIPALAQLLHGDQPVSDFQETLENRLELLHSVLSIPSPSERLISPVRALHLSFRDFLLDSERRDVNPFWVDEAKAHLVLAERCVMVMRTSLRENICELSHPGIPNTSVSRETLQRCLPKHAQYACVFWIYHVEQARIDSVTGKIILEFLEMHLLHWLEALSLMGRAFESVAMVERLKSVTQNAGLSQLSELLSDSIRFTGASAIAIDYAPLQVYWWALVFAPLRSRVRTVFHARVPDCISIQPQEKNGWSNCLQRLRAPSLASVVSNLSFSPDSKLLASVSENLVSVWDVRTGAIVFEKLCDTYRFKKVHSVAFSADSALIIIVAFLKIEVLRAVTGQYVCHLCHPQSNTTSMSLLTPDLIASGSAMGDIRIWKLETGRLVSKLEGHRRPVRTLAVSADERLLASGSDDGTIMIWQTHNWIHIKTLVAPEGGTVSRVAFSSDSNLIAVATSAKLTTRPTRSLSLLTSDTLTMDDMGSLGDTTRGKIVIFSVDSCRPPRILCEYHRSPDLMFRSGSVLVVSDPKSVAMSTWQADTGQLLHELRDDPRRWFTATALSCESRFKVSAGFETTEIDADSGVCRQRLNMPDGGVVGSTAVAISADLKLIASAARGSGVNVCQVSLVEDDCPQLQTPRSEEVIRAISPDLTLYASIDLETLTWNIRETTTGRCRHTFSRTHPHERLVFSPDSRSVLFMDNYLSVWDIETRKLLMGIESTMRDNRFSETAFSPTSELIATGHFGTIQLWEIATGECIGTIHTYFLEHISLLVFSSDSAWVAADQGEIVDVWDITTRRRVQTIRKPPGDQWNSRCLAISSQTKVVAIASNDGLVGIWHLGTGKLLDLWASGIPSSQLSFENDVPSSRLSFQNSDTQLLTNYGLIDINLARAVAHQIESPAIIFLSPVLSKEEDDAWCPVFGGRTGIGLDQSGNWITWNDRPFLLTPLRPSKQHFEVHGSTVLHRPASGRPMLIIFDPEKLTHLFPS